METKETVTETKKAIQELSDVAEIRYLQGDNTEIFQKNGFPAARIRIRQEDGSETVEVHDRIWLHRSFPFDLLEAYISVQNKDQEEIGLIRSLDAFDADAREILQKELDQKYYTPKITRIQFTLQDTFRSLLRVGEDKVYVTDNYGNRYVIESLAKLDRRSLRKIELYL